MDTIIECDGSGELRIGGNKRWCVINDEVCQNKKSHFLRSSGDLAFKNCKGDLYFKGRKDNIMKYKGRKFSILKINNILEGDPLISNFVVIFENESSRLLLFVVFKEEVSHMLIEKKRRDWTTRLKKIYPNFPPIDFYTLPFLPVTFHGKADYKKLLQLSQQKSKNMNFEIVTKDNYYEIIINTWKEYINHEQVAENDNFVLSGGDSISALQFLSDIEWKFQISAPALIDTLLNSTFQELVNQVKSYLYNKEKLNDIKYDHTTLQEKSSPPLKKQKTGTPNLKKQCYRMFSRQGSILQCNCSNDQSAFSSAESCNNCNSSTSPFSSFFKFDLKKCIDASPCVAYFLKRKEMLVFIGSHAGMFCCVNVLKDKLEWEVLLPDRIESSACLSSCGNFVFVGCYDHCLYCFDIEQGGILWKFESEAEIKSSPIVSSQNRIFFGSHDKNLYAIDVSGKMVWKNKIGKGSVFSSPTLSESLNAVCAASLDGVISLLKMDSGAIIWSYNYNKPLFSSPRIFCSSLYIGTTDGSMLCFDLSGNMKFNYKTNGPVFSSAASLLSQSGIIFGCHDCNVYCVDENAKLLWKFCSDSPVYSTPFSFMWKNQYCAAIASTSGMVYFVQQSDGKVIFQYKCPGKIFSSPIIIDGFFIIGCRDNYLYFYKF